MIVIAVFTGIIEGLFVSIPESVGLLVFGLGLMGSAATGRWLLSRSEASEEDETSQSEVLRK